MSDKLANYDRDKNITGSVSGYTFFPDYGSQVSLESKNCHINTADNFYKKIPRGLNLSSIKLDLSFSGKTEDQANSFLHLLEYFNTTPSESGLLSLGKLSDQGVSIDFPDGGVYKNMGDFLVENYEFKFHRNFFDISLNLSNNGYYSLSNWKTSSYLNTQNIGSDWESGKSYKKFDIVYHVDYEQVLGQTINRIDNFYYCTEDHTSTDQSSPSSGGGFWTRSFLFDPNDQNILGHDKDSDIYSAKSSFTSFHKTQSNEGLLKDLKLSFKSRSDIETRALVHFFEKHENYKPFEYAFPEVYDGQKFFVLKSLRHRFVYQDCNDIDVIMDEIVKFKAHTEMYLTQTTSGGGSEEPVESYVLKNSESIVTEGDVFTIHLLTSLVSPGTIVPYEITGVSESDIGATSLFGEFQVNESGITSVSFEVSDNLLSDMTLVLSLTGAIERRTTIILATIKPSFSLSSSSYLVNEGDEFLVSLSADNFENGTVSYQVNGVSQSDIDQPISGEFNVQNGESSILFKANSDGVKDGRSVFNLYLTDYPDTSIRVSILDTSKPATYSLSTQYIQVGEGTQFKIFLNTEGVPDGTSVPYQISGVNDQDIHEDLEGSFEILNNFSSQSFSVRSDKSTEGTEVLTLTLNNQLASIDVDIMDFSRTPTYNLVRSSSFVEEGGVIKVLLFTSNVPNNTLVDYEITGVSPEDIGEPLTGQFEVLEGHSSKQFQINLDQKTEGTEIFTLKIKDEEESIDVIIDDTSRSAPTYFLQSSVSEVYEGGSFEIYLSTTDVLNCTPVGYQIQGVDSSDIEQSLQGIFQITEGYASKTFNTIPIYNEIADGSKTFLLSLDNGEDDISITIKDDPTYTLYSIDAEQETIVLGDAVSPSFDVLDAERETIELGTSL